MFSTILLYLTTLAAAIPAPQSDPTMPAAPDNPITHLYICTDALFAGDCTNLHVNVSACYNVPQAYDDKVSSAGPDRGTFCTLYSEAECRGKALPFTYPGIRNLGRYGMDDALSSLRCDFITGWKTHL